MVKKITEYKNFVTPDCFRHVYDFFDGAKVESVALIHALESTKEFLKDLVDQPKTIKLNFDYSPDFAVSYSHQRDETHDEQQARITKNKLRLTQLEAEMKQLKADLESGEL